MRKYVMTRLDTGDYLLPSNDGETIWRLSAYVDGPSQGLDWPSDRQVWGAWRWVGRGSPERAEDIDDWNLWELYTGTLPTRQEAIDEAMAAEK